MHPRVHTLVTAFDRIHRDRMADVPIVNARLRVEALGFESVGGDRASALQGVLITPWFMSLVQLPSTREELTDSVGRTVQRHFGAQRFDCLIAYEEGVGRYESCALFSPMHEFQDQAHASQVAAEVLRSLRAVPEPQPAESRRADATPPPSRRLFMFGRGAA